MAEESSSAGAAALSAIPSLMSALQRGQSGTPTLMPAMTPEQYAMFEKMIGVSSGLAPLQGTILDAMMRGGTAADYGQEAINSYYQNTLADPAMQELYNETLPSINNRLSSKYWNTIRPTEQGKATLNTQTQLGKQYGELVMSNELAKRQAQESSRTSGMSLLGQMQEQTLTAKPFDIVFQPSKQKGIMDFLKGHKGSIIGSLAGGPDVFSNIVGGSIGKSATGEKWETPFY